MSGIQSIGQIAHALLTFAQELDDLQANRISQSMEEPSSAFDRMRRGDRHGSMYINKY